MDGVRMLLVAASRGLKVRAEGDQLVFRGPRSTRSLKDEIAARKVEILAILRARPELADLDPFTAAAALSFDGEVLPEGQPREGVPFDGAARAMWEASTGKCYVCGGSRWWKRVERDGPWVCGTCHPPLLDESRIAWVEVDE